MIPASLHKSRMPTSWKRVQWIDITFQIVWNMSRRSMRLAYWSACFQMISAVLAYRAWSMTITMSSKYSFCHLFSDCFKLSETVYICGWCIYSWHITSNISNDAGRWHDSDIEFYPAWNILCYCIHMPGNLLTLREWHLCKVWAIHDIYAIHLSRCVVPFRVGSLLACRCCPMSNWEIHRAGWLPQDCLFIQVSCNVL